MRHSSSRESPGTLELFHRSTRPSEDRRRGRRLPRRRIPAHRPGGLPTADRRADPADTDTLLVFGLDHVLSEQEAAPDEVTAIREWLKREGTCLLLAPHHDVGFTDDLKQRQTEYLHHGETGSCRASNASEEYTRSLMKGLDVPVYNQWGLRPALAKGTKEIAPLTAFLGRRQVGACSKTSLHSISIRICRTTKLLKRTASRCKLLARQAIDLDRPHPFTASGNTEFNCLLWMPPKRAARGRHRASRLRRTSPHSSAAPTV